MKPEPYKLKPNEEVEARMIEELYRTQKAEMQVRSRTGGPICGIGTIAKSQCLIGHGRGVSGKSQYPLGIVSKAATRGRRKNMDADVRAAIADMELVQVEGISTIRRIVDEQQCLALHWGDESEKQVCDLFTASHIIAVYDGVRDELKVKIEKDLVDGIDTFFKIVDICFKTIDKAKKNG